MAGTRTPTRSRVLLVGLGAAALALGASSAASAATDTTEPGEEMHHSEDTSAPATLAVDGSADPSSPEAEAFCEAELAGEAAFNSEDEAAVGPAVEAITAAAEPVGLAEPVAQLIELVSSEDFGPDFEEVHAEIIDYMRANCGYAEIAAAASEYEFNGLPSEFAAGPVIVSLENVGEQMHEVAIFRINDDVTLSIEELLELPEEEAFGMVTTVLFAFAAPGTTSYGVGDFTPGRYAALCFFPENMTPEVFAALEEAGVGGPDDTFPEGTLPGGVELGPPHFTLGMMHEFTVT